MIYGSRDHWKNMMNHALRLAKEHDVQLVYASILGSISRGIAAIDSDCDVRFLFVKNDFPNKKYSPEKCVESDIIFRYFRYKDHRTDINLQYTYDRMAFWELTSFLKLLVNPQIGNETQDKNGLYYITEHTFQSPYTWDPFGIQQMIVPFLYQYPKPLYTKKHFCRMMDKSGPGQRILAKDYLDALWAALSLKWMQQYEFPTPVNMDVLETVIEDSKVRQKIIEWVQDILSLCNEEVSKTEKKFRGYSRYHVYCERNPVVDRMISEAYSISDRLDSYKESVSVEIQSEQVNRLIDAVIRRITSSMSVIGVSKDTSTTIF